MRRQLATKSVSVVLLVLNAIGAAVYVLRASSSWKIPAEHGEIPLSGEAFVWFLGIAPVVAVFLLLNLIWGGRILTEKQSESGLLWLLILPLWIIAIGIDFAHH